MAQSLPKTMTAMAASSPGGPEMLVPISRPVPAPGPAEILIRVRACGVNRPDLLQRQGVYPPPPGASDLIGLEVAGEVVAIGQDVTIWQIGDRVTALTNGGGYAQYCAVPAIQALRLPNGFDWAEAAALPENFFTVWSNVFERGRLRPGETFLVHGGTSGIGTCAIQLAAAHGARVFATAGGETKARFCEAIGAERCVDYHTEDFGEVFAELVPGGIDVILDMVGGDYTPRNLKLLAPEGRLVQIAYLKGGKVDAHLEQIMRKRLTLTGSTLRPRTTAEKGRIASSLAAIIWPMLDDGLIKPVIHQRFPLAEAAAAHTLLESGTTMGKIILMVD
jgi:putative PIG3 family NAD(P)H quinone oxidoreductase